MKLLHLTPALVVVLLAIRALTETSLLACIGIAATPVALAFVVSAIRTAHKETLAGLKKDTQIPLETSVAIGSYHGRYRQARRSRCGS